MVQATRSDDDDGWRAGGGERGVGGQGDEGARPRARGHGVWAYYSDATSLTVGATCTIDSDVVVGSRECARSDASHRPT